jgi:hypothetical protein
MKSNNNNNDDDDDDDDNTAMGSVHAQGDTFLTFGLKALTETNTSRLATVQPSTLHFSVPLLTVSQGRADVSQWKLTHTLA